jgi:hypothetical protein
MFVSANVKLIQTNMYTTLLFIHSMIRWFLVISFFYTLGRAYYGWFNKQKFNQLDRKALLFTSSLAHLQLVIGVWLYFVSPIVNYFLHNFSTAIHQKEFRFFGMEHALIMLIAITLITIGSAKAKRNPVDTLKFKTIAIWYSLGFVLMLAGIPFR